LLDLLEEEVASARKMPVGGGVLVDRKHMLDLIDQLRVAIPANIRQASQLLQRRTEALADAEREAARIVESAQREADRRLSETAIVRQAEERARQIIAEAEARAAQRIADAAEQARLQQEEADRYALAILTRLDTLISNFLGSVRQGIESLRDSRDE
jgi:flagellar biosynthesis/type III secretory pathway protein FliH